VKSYYKVSSISIHSSFPWKNIWKVKVPSRVAFFMWPATLGKIITLDNLRKMNIIVMEWCYVCKNCGESIDHLFTHCMIATKLWSIILQLFVVVWVMPRSVIDMLESWRGQKGNRVLMTLWRLVSLCLMWCLWKKQNARSFEDCESDLLNLKKLVIQTLFTWRVTLHSMSDCFLFFRFVFFSLWFRGIIYISCIFWAASLCAFLEYTLLIKIYIYIYIYLL
jgi:hypothetical protein